MTEYHIIVAEKPAWIERRYRPEDDGTPTVIPDSLQIYPHDGSPAPRYTCSCGKEFSRWTVVEEHFTDVIAENERHSRQMHSDQATLSEIGN